MDAGDAVRSKTERGDALALLAISEISKERPTDPSGKPESKPKTAYILRSLKHLNLNLLSALDQEDLIRKYHA